MKLLKGSWLLKFAAFVAALLTYFYIQGVLASREEEKKILDPSYKLIRLTAKNLPVNVRIATSPPKGYQIQADKVTTLPSHVIVVAPEALLEDASNAETALIDISENTKTTVKSIPLESVSGVHLSGAAYYVDVTIPIKKILIDPPPEESQS